MSSGGASRTATAEDLGTSRWLFPWREQITGCAGDSDVAVYLREGESTERERDIATPVNGVFAANPQGKIALLEEKTRGQRGEKSLSRREWKIHSDHHKKGSSSRRKSASKIGAFLELRNFARGENRNFARPTGTGQGQEG